MTWEVRRRLVKVRAIAPVSASTNAATTVSVSASTNAATTAPFSTSTAGTNAATAARVSSWQVFLLGVFCFCVANYDTAKSFVTDSGVNTMASKILPSKIKASEISTAFYDIIKESDQYVEMPVLLKQISDIIDRKNGTGEFYIMYSAKGVGKSTIVERAVKGKKGVLMLKLITTYGLGRELGKEQRKV